MQSTQGNIFLSVQNGKSFLDEHAEELEAAIPPALTERLDDILAALTDTVSMQYGHVRTAQILTRAQLARRAVLLQEHMAPIARLARLELPNTPEVAPLRMPRGKPTAERLVADARGMAEAVKAYEALFVSNGLAADFIEQLVTAADNVIGTLTARAQSRGRVRTATVGLRRQLVEARRIVHVIDAFVRTASKEKPQLYEGWKLVIRLPRRSSTRAPSAPTATAATPGAFAGSHASTDAASSGPAIAA